MAECPTCGAYVMLLLGEERFGVPVDRVSGVVRYEEATPVPRAPESVLGVVNLRGRIVPVVDLRRRLSGEPFVPGPTARIVISDSDRGALGIAVDAATDVIDVDRESIRPVPDGILGADAARAFSGVVERDGRIIILLDIDQALPAGIVAPPSEAQEGSADV